MPAGPLGQIAAAQYASDEERWEQVRSKAGIGLAEMRLLVAAKFLLASERADPAVDVAVLELLAYAPASVGIPILPERLNDASAGTRATAFASLQTAALPFSEETFEYDPGGTPEERAAATARWRQWWARQHASSLRSDVPKMLAELDSPHLLRRRAADWSLRLLSKGDAGYVAEDSVDRRKAADARWRAWWEQTSQQLR